MPKHLTLQLSEEQRDELIKHRNSDPRPYLRERCAAMLKIADGMKVAHVARAGLLRPYDPDALYEWRRRYLREGLKGLLIRKGRGRKPAFSPAHQHAEEAHSALLHVVRRDRHQLGETTSRWTLRQLLAHCQQWGWGVSSQAGLWHLLDRLHLHWKRGRDHVHSPDPLYEPKRAFIGQLREQAARSQGREALLFLDEVTYYRQPSLASAYEEAGAVRPFAERSYRSNTKTSVVAALDASSGRVVFGQASKTSVPALVSLYQRIAATYPDAERIWVVLDNWPVHFHPDLLVALQQQVSPFPFHPAPNWTDQPSAKALKHWSHLQLSIQLVPLPTYASWLNPVEKLWRQLKQDILHLHRWADDLETLRQRVLDFLDQFADGSLELLHTVGLRIPGYILKVHQRAVRRSAGVSATAPAASLAGA